MTRPGRRPFDSTKRTWMTDSASPSESRTASSASTRMASKPPWRSAHTRTWRRRRLRIIRARRRRMPTWHRVRRTSSPRTWRRSQPNCCLKEVRVVSRALTGRPSSRRSSRRSSKTRWRERRPRTEVATQATSWWTRTRRAWVDRIRNLISARSKTSKSKWGKRRQSSASRPTWSPSSTWASIRGKMLGIRSCSRSLS